MISKLKEWFKRYQERQQRKRFGPPIGNYSRAFDILKAVSDKQQHAVEREKFLSRRKKDS